MNKLICCQGETSVPSFMAFFLSELRFFGHKEIFFKEAKKKKNSIVLLEFRKTDVIVIFYLEKYCIVFLTIITFFFKCMIW